MLSETGIQIGDWLHFEYTNPIDGFVSFNFKVSQLRRDYGGELFVWGEKTPDGKHFGNMGEVSRIRPIPLTVEILEKNGWHSRMNGTGEFYLKKPLVDAAIITKTIAGFQMNHGPFNGLSIHYVHQLQHALRLCGIEKEIQI